MLFALLCRNKDLIHGSVFFFKVFHFLYRHNIVRETVNTGFPVNAFAI